MRTLVAFAVVAACQTGQETQFVHIFKGGQDAIAYTADREGANLPAQYRPWRYLQSVPRSDPRLQVGRDREAMLEVDARGYSIAIMRVTIHTPG